MKKKDLVILTAAIVVPGGLTLLGVWKAYELYRKKTKVVVLSDVKDELEGKDEQRVETEN